MLAEDTNEYSLNLIEIPIDDDINKLTLLMECKNKVNKASLSYHCRENLLEFIEENKKDENFNPFKFADIFNKKFEVAITNSPEWIRIQPDIEQSDLSEDMKKEITNFLIQGILDGKVLMRNHLKRVYPVEYSKMSYRKPLKVDIKNSFNLSNYNENKNVLKYYKNNDYLHGILENSHPVHEKIYQDNMSSVYLNESVGTAVCKSCGKEFKLIPGGQSKLCPVCLAKKLH